jgi:HEAT repeat protein
VERPDYVVFLRPPELAKLFTRTDDQRLKKSVIDILENVGSPASLEVLRTCLDDPDPEIQVYALEAADRLLGT